MFGVYPHISCVFAYIGVGMYLKRGCVGESLATLQIVLNFHVL